MSEVNDSVEVIDEEATTGLDKYKRKDVEKEEPDAIASAD
jgi:hypothetical protein